jgi:hypothetical protein
MEEKKIRIAKKYSAVVPESDVCKTVRSFAKVSMDNTFSGIEKQIQKLEQSIEDAYSDIDRKEAKLGQLRLDLEQLTFIRS